MYAISRQTDSATAVDCSINCRLLNLNETQLVTAGGNRLSVYRVVVTQQASTANARSRDVPWVDHEQQTPSAGPTSNGKRNMECHMECIYTTCVSGRINSLASAFLPGTLSPPRDTLLVSADDAKLSLLQWDPETYSLISVSLHCFEDDEVLKAGYTRSFPPGRVVSDPESRAAAMVVYGRSLAVLPLHATSSSSATTDAGHVSGIPGVGGGFDDRDIVNKNADVVITTEKPPQTPAGSVTRGPSLNSDAGVSGAMARSRRQDNSPQHLSLMSYCLPLETIDPKLMATVVDYTFLTGYYEPTLLLLYEPNPTTAGRAAVRLDTFFIIAVSLSTKDKNFAVIWSVQNLPYDCLRVHAVPRPVGGIVIFGANSLIYLNQSVPPYGIALNDNAAEWTSFPLKQHAADAKILLDGASATFISSRSMVICLQSGDVYTFTLLVDNMNNVKSMHLDRAASSVITSALTKCADIKNGCIETPVSAGKTGSFAPTITNYSPEGILFLGSRLGNSLLLRYWERDSFAVRIQSVIDTPTLVKPEHGRSHGGVKNGITDIDEELSGAKKAKMDIEPIQDDVDLYGEVITARSEEQLRVARYSFEVCDSLLNIAPCRSMTMGECFNLADEFKNTFDPVVDTIIASGHGKNGALTVLQRTIRPHLITSSHIPNARKLWTVGTTIATRKTAIETPTVPGAAWGEKSGTPKDSATGEGDKDGPVGTSADKPGAGGDSTTDGAAASTEVVNIKDAHRYLLISKQMDTMVLEMKNEITELERSGYEMNEQTIAVGNVALGASVGTNTEQPDNYMVQVTPHSLVLLKNATRLQHIPLETPFPVSQASICDPYVILLTDNGELLIAVLDACHNIDDPYISDEGDSESYEFVISSPRIQQNIPAAAVCVYKDTTGMFVTRAQPEFSTTRPPRQPSGGGGFRNLNKIPDFSLGTEQAVNAMPGTAGTSALPDPLKAAASFLNATSMSVDDEDELLYGDTPAFFSTTTVKEETKDTKPAGIGPGQNGLGFPDSLPGTRAAGPKKDFETYWAIVCRENGLLEIFSLPDFKLVYLVKRFPIGHRTMKDTDPDSLEASSERQAEDKVPIVRELLVTPLGATAGQQTSSYTPRSGKSAPSPAGHSGRPFIFALLETEELLIYETFLYSVPERVVSDHLHVRFRKVQHEVIPRIRKFQSRPRQPPTNISVPPPPIIDPALEYSAGPMVPFTNMAAGYSGVFLCGGYPYWIIMTPAGILRAHPMPIDGPIWSFTPFHNVNCRHGFAYLNSSSEMRICQLPASLLLDHSCPVTKVNIKATVHHVVYLMNSRTYALTTSVSEPCHTVVTLLGDEKQFEAIDKTDSPNFVFPTVPRFTVSLYSPETYEPIPSTSIEMEEFEAVTELKEIQLKSEGTVSGVQNYMVIGTIWNYGEEVLIRGRIIICEEVEVVPEPGQPLTKTKLKTLYAKEQKGPVTSICAVNGYLVTGMGQKVYIWSFKDNDLLGISFLDLQIYIHKLTSIRSLIMVGDVFNSVSLLRYQEQSKALSLVCRDLRQINALALDFIVDGKHLAFLISDEHENIYIYTYEPEKAESVGGSRFLRRADFHLGSPVTCFYRIRCALMNSLGALEEGRAATTPVYRHMNVYSTLDGSLGVILPLSERTYRRLLMLQNLLVAYLPHPAGLNPKSYRVARTPHSLLNNPQKNLLDGDLITQFLNLSSTERFEVSKRLGADKEQIMDDILEILRLTTHC